MTNVPRARRVLMVISGLGSGGGESQMIYLAAGLAELGHDVTVVCLRWVRRDLRPLHEAGVRILVLDAARPADEVAERLLSAVLERLNK